MPKYVVSQSSIQDIADSIREQNGSSDTYTPRQMGAAIRALTSLPGGGEIGEILMMTENGPAWEEASASGQIYYHTTAEWNAQLTLISQAGAFYVYSDHRQVTNEDRNMTYNVPGLKIGDGVSYLSDLPFVGEGSGSMEEVEEELDELTHTVQDHVGDDEAHVTDEDRESWDNKVRAQIDNSNPELLVIF